MTSAASSGDSAWACMALVAAAGTVACGPLAGQAAPRLRDAAAPGVVTVTAGTQYRAGWLHRALLGAHYRERSEEHTSELQSRLHLVCRLLLEKKKKIQKHDDVNNTKRQ